jgi:hypothetical protein
VGEKREAPPPNVTNRGGGGSPGAWGSRGADCCCGGGGDGGGHEGALGSEVAEEEAGSQREQCALEMQAKYLSRDGARMGRSLLGDWGALEAPRGRRNVRSARGEEEDGEERRGRGRGACSRRCRLGVEVGVCGGRGGRGVPGWQVCGRACGRAGSSVAA